MNDKLIEAARRHLRQGIQMLRSADGELEIGTEATTTQVLCDELGLDAAGTKTVLALIDGIADDTPRGRPPLPDDAIVDWVWDAVARGVLQDEAVAYALRHVPPDQLEAAKHRIRRKLRQRREGRT